jgi:hypothetical protein
MEFTESMEKRIRSLRIFTLLLLTFAMMPKSFAQVAGGTILGTVNDPSGAVVANAKLIITDLACHSPKCLRAEESVTYRLGSESSLL